MLKRKTLEHQTVAALLLTLTIFAVLVALAYRFQDIKISSADVGNILYERVAAYNRAILDEPRVAKIITIAETNPGDLSGENRVIYLIHQRTFFDGWEAALNYNDAGVFDADRWNVWNSWYIDEVRRRPRFGWIENRKYYAGAFLRHVDESLNEMYSEPTFEEI